MILTYPIDSICLAFVFNGRRCQHNWIDPYGMRSSIIFLPILKILFIELEWLKILKDPFEEDVSIVPSDISDILFTYFESFMC